jgi:rare lipoprotein A
VSKSLCVAAILAAIVIVNMTAVAFSRPLWGRATYYAGRYQGRTMACGGAYKHRKLVAAVDRNIDIPCGKKLRVKNRSNGRVVTVRVKDRCACYGRTIIDLSRRAARRLDYVQGGWTRVRVTVLR